jgi:DNA adenine methylase
MRRPIVRYYGGKWNISDFIISHFPPHRIYVEPFGGGGSVLIKKQRVELEIYNDLHSEMINVFKHLRDPRLFPKLKRMLELTPYSRDEYELAYLPAKNGLEQARRTLVRSGLGHGALHNNRTGFRGIWALKKWSNKEWENWKLQLENFHDRLKHVVIENIDAIELIKKNDAPHTLVYADPPYVKTSIEYQDKSKYYRHEMTEADHEQLAEVLHAFSGMVIISGYDSELYRRLYRGWQTNAVRAYAQGNKKGRTLRKEMIWLNPLCAQQLTQKSMLFELERVAP